MVIKLERPVMAAISTAFLLIVWQKKKTVFKLEREFDDDMKFEKKIRLKMTQLERQRQWTDRRTDGQAQTFEIMFCSLVCW